MSINQHILNKAFTAQLLEAFIACPLKEKE